MRFYHILRGLLGLRVRYDRCLVCGRCLIDFGGAPDYYQWHYSCENKR